MPLPLSLSFSDEIVMLIGPPVFEMSQKAGLEPDELISALVPAMLANGVHTTERSVARTNLPFMRAFAM